MFVAGLDCLHAASETVPPEELVAFERQARRMGLHTIAHQIPKEHTPRILDGELRHVLRRSPDLNGGGAIVHLILRAALVCYSKSGAHSKGKLSDLVEAEMKNPASLAWCGKISKQTASEVATCFESLRSGHHCDLAQIDRLLDPAIMALIECPDITRKMLEKTGLILLGIDFDRSNSVSSVWEQKKETSSSNTDKRATGKQKHDLRKIMRNMLEGLQPK